MASSAKVRVLRQVPVKGLERLILESQEEGFQFLVRMREEWRSASVRFDGPHEAVLVAKLGGEIVGVCGHTPDFREDDRNVGKVRRLYVSKRQRRRGIGTQLLLQLYDVAKSHFRELRVRAPGPSACAFYESLGFRKAGRRESYTHYIDLTQV